MRPVERCVASVAVLVLWLGAAGCAPKSPVLAEVGKHTITARDFDEALANLPESYRILTVNLEGKRRILDNLVKKSLLVQEAERRGFQNNPELKARMKEMKAQAQEQLRAQIREFEQRVRDLDRQVYENAMLQELNERLQGDDARREEISDVDVQEYYAEYVRKLKVLNPNARIPPLEDVRPQIQAILVEERLLEALEKDRKVAVKEDLFRKLYESGATLKIDGAPER